MVEIVGVGFAKTGKTYYFDPLGAKYEMGDIVPQPRPLVDKNAVQNSAENGTGRGVSRSSRRLETQFQIGVTG